MSVLQVNNESLNAQLTSLPNHVGALQSNGQQPGAAVLPNGKTPPTATTVANKIPTTCTSTSTSVSSPNSKQSMVQSPANQLPGVNSGLNSTNKKHSPTITNLLAPSSGASTVTSNGVSNNVTAIPSPVSSTSSLSSISMPSRLGSSTPPVVPGGISVSTNLTNTPAVTSTVNSAPLSSVGPVNTSAETNSQLVTTSAAPTVLPSPVSLALPPTLNGPGMPPLMGLGGMPLSPLTAPGYRPMYPPYGLYSHYGLHPHPYGIPQTSIPSPALSPRTAETRRDSSLVLSKPIRPVTPNSNSNTSTSSQSNLNSSTPAGPNSFHLLGSSANNSPRGFSPTRERDNYRYVLRNFTKYQNLSFDFSTV